MKRWLIAFCLSSCLCGSLWADAGWIKNEENGMSHNWYIGVGAGVTFPMVNKNMFVPGGPSWPAQQYIKHNQDTEPLASIGAGYTWTGYEDWFPFWSLGANYTYASSSNVHGIIHQAGLPGFSDFNYQYAIQRQTLMAMAKLDIVRWNNIMPYLALSAGFSRNKAYQYSEQALTGVVPRISPGYDETHDIYGSYILAAGFDFILTDNLWASLEYNYGDFGYVNTGKGVNATSAGGFNFSNVNLQNKLTASTILLSLSYYVG